MSEESGPGRPNAGQLTVTCEIPGCTRRIAYSGSGRRPKYCGETIDGLPHTRLTAYRLSRGEVTTPESAGPQQEETSGERPVSLARLTLETLLNEVRAVTAGHETRMAGLAQQIAEVVAVIANPDAALAEVAGAHREARGAIDAAEAERDAALAAAREAERQALAERQRRASAEDAAEQALTEAEAAAEQRDQANDTAREVTRAADRVRAELTTVRAEWERSTERAEALAGELEQARTQLATVGAELGQMRDALAAARQETLDVAATRDALTAELHTERELTQLQRRRADEAEREASRAAGSVEQLRGELSAAREAEHQLQGETARLATELATVTAQLAAAHELVQTTKEHAAERIGDHRQRSTAAEQETQRLRNQLENARAEHTAELEQLRRQLNPPPAAG